MFPQEEGGVSGGVGDPPEEQTTDDVREPCGFWGS